jgi:hypothetical protein
MHPNSCVLLNIGWGYSMIKPPFELSKNILKEVNRNIYLILEMFFESCKGLDYETFTQEIFPEHFHRENPEKCISILEDLRGYTIEHFERELPPIYEYALYMLFDWWVEVTDNDKMDRIIRIEDILTPDDEYVAKNINDIEEYKSFMFDDWDFLDASDIAKNFLENPWIIEGFMHIDIEEYLVLMPNDIKEKILSQIEERKDKIAKVIGEEELIVKSIYSITKLLERSPLWLKKTSETELSDSICNALFLSLQNEGFIVVREMPGGYANKTIGELDFCVYTYNDNVLKIVAVGENKEWGNYNDPTKQLIGYMDKDTTFGFSIIFNKETQFKTIVKKRREVLESFNVEENRMKHFETVQISDAPFNLNDVLITAHINPENDRAVNIYHFIVNANSPERKEAARQARK